MQMLWAGEKMQNCCIIHGARSFCFVRIVQFGISRSKCVCVAEHKEMVLCVHSCSMTLFRTMRPRHKSMKSISHIWWCVAPQFALFYYLPFFAFPGKFVCLETTMVLQLEYLLSCLMHTGIFICVTAMQIARWAWKDFGKS